MKRASDTYSVEKMIKAYQLVIYLLNLLLSNRNKITLSWTFLLKRELNRKAKFSIYQSINSVGPHSLELEDTSIQNDLQWLGLASEMQRISSEGTSNGAPLCWKDPSEVLDLIVKPSLPLKVIEPAWGIILYIPFVLGARRDPPTGNVCHCNLIQDGR